MRTTLIVAGLILLVSGCAGPAFSPVCEPQYDPANAADRPSPYASHTLTLEGHEVVVCYGRPYTRGREIFGELVPYDTLWRTGANEPTIIHLPTSATLAGVPLDSGQYSLYTVPSRDQWTLVINASTSQWGLTRDEAGAQGNVQPNAYTPEVREQEVARVPIETERGEFMEQLTIGATIQSTTEARIHVDWADTRIVIPLALGTSGTSD